ncbi:heterokaryon incompatibility protein-domain-containing protein [Xylaria telfairii]|nr:heterokaryon incompatibility protein-domain-containing protein [Xylaria telfairii]
MSQAAIAPIRSNNPQEILSHKAIAIVKKSTLCIPCHELLLAAWHIGGEKKLEQRRYHEKVKKGADKGCGFCDAVLTGMGKLPLDFDLVPLNFETGLIFGRVRIEARGYYNYYRKDVMIDFIDQNAPSFVGLHSSSMPSLSFVSRMISQCKETHQHCGKEEEQSLPKRILSIDLINGKDIKLVEGSLERARYACLSHCWGETKSIVTTSENLGNHKKGLLWESLPRLYRDVITFCWELEIQYLWIDALCIKQDDVKDWAEQSSEMATIYENSYITIAATSAHNHDSGCTTQLAPEHCWEEVGNIRQPESSTSFSILMRQSLHHPYEITRPWWRLDNKAKYPLLSRAWAYQERILSPRVIHFLPNELMWECRSGLQCECLELSLTSVQSRRFIKGGLFSPVSEKRCGKENCTCEKSVNWSSLLGGYVRLELTIPGDKLPALSGLARRIQGPQQDRYLAGLWESELPESLFWSPGYQAYKHPRPQSPTAPTWSWASIPGEIMYELLRKDCLGNVQQLFPLQIKSIDVKPDTANPYGSVSPGSALVISGILSSGFLHYENHDHIFLHIETGKKIKFHPDYDLQYPGQYHVSEGTALVCVYHHYYAYPPGTDNLYLMILRVVDEHSSKYERIGLAYTRRLKPEPSDISTMALANSHEGVITLV